MKLKAWKWLKSFASSKSLNRSLQQNKMLFSSALFQYFKQILRSFEFYEIFLDSESKIHTVRIIKFAVHALQIPQAISPALQLPDGVQTPCLRT